MTTNSTMTAEQFDYLCQLVYKESAIVLEKGKEYLVESRLGPVARKAGLDSVGALVDQLVKARSPELRGFIIDAMTTNETSFFRDIHPWKTLRESILPELIEARRATKRLTCWCAASSSGQEPYSLAMVLHEDFPSIVREWEVKIYGTDLSETMVDRCRSGRFSQLEVNRGLPAMSLAKWFHRDGSEWMADERLRSMLDIRVGNLASPTGTAWLPRVDLVMMRNVLIYFDTDTKKRIVASARDRLTSDGVLMLGSSEVSLGPDQGFDREQIGKTVFFRRGSDDRSAAGRRAG